MTTGAATSPRISDAARLVILAGLGVFFAADDQTSVVALLPSMISDLGVSQDEFFKAAWIVNGYILGYVMIMPLIARAADAIGLGRGYAIALTLFCFGSAWVALSNDLTILTIARGVQAVGAGAILPISMAMVTSMLPRRQRPMGLGAIAAASEIGSMFGPLWGGIIADLWGWRGVFWINLPMCLPLAAAIWMMAPSAATGAWKRIDYLGATLFGASLACLAFALTDDPISPRPVGIMLALWAGAIVFFALFIVRQMRASLPMVVLARLKSVPLSAALLANGLLGAALVVALINVPLFTNTILREDALQGGLNLMRLSVGVAIGAFLGGILGRHFWLMAVAAAGAILAGIGYIGMSMWGDDPGFLLLTLPLLVAGLGFGLVIAPLATAVLDQVEESERAIWSALLNVMRLLGGLIAVALLTSKGLGSFYASAGQVPLDNPNYEAIITGLQVDTYSDTCLYAAAICFFSLIPIAFLTRRRHEDEEPVV